MMNELQRQTYLSALGVDTYMPRWHLPFAPVSVACQLPEAVVGEEPLISSIAAINFNTVSSDVTAPQIARPQIEGGITPINSLISDIFDTKKIVKIESPVKKSIEKIADAAAQQVIAPFSLSVWRPIEGLMIVDSRNTQLALPTDALLKNIFRHLLRKTFPTQQSPNFKEEVLRCPMIENSFAKRTADDARAELQTWLSVQAEIKPFTHLWLMGENAISYLALISGNAQDQTAGGNHAKEMQEHWWRSSAIADSSIQALLLPSLNELLLNPLFKKSFVPAIRQYHV